MKCRRYLLWLGGIAAVVAALVVAVLVLYEPLLIAAGSHLLREDSPAPGAAIGVVLMGDNTMTRAARAVALHNNGTIKRIILMREKDLLFPGTTSAIAPADVTRDFFYAQGIAGDDLTYLTDCATTSTLDEAECIRNYLDATNQRPDRLVVITTWTHSARAGWLFDKVMVPTKIDMTAARLDVVTPQNWWQHELGVLSVFNEYLKWTYWQAQSWRGRL